MHTLGKVLLWLNVVGALGAIVLTAKLLDVRNSWVKEIEQRQKQVEQNAGQLALLREEHRQLRSELGDTLFGWDRSWDIPAGNVAFDQQGGLQVQGLGVNQGFVTPGADPTNPMPGQLPIVHVFQVTPAGTHFAGTFQATQVGADASALAPLWHVEPADFAHLEQGAAGWRFRMEMPASFTSEFSRLRTLRSGAMRDLENQQFYLQDITEQEQAAGNLLTARREQLEGNGVSPGLVGNLTAAGDARDAEALRLDALRRQVQAKQERIETLRTEVQQLEGQLSTQAPAQPQTQPQTNIP
jgi:hypothetical protein